MENPKISPKWLFILGLLAFQLLFWKQGQGVNVIFFTAFTVGALVYLDANRWQSKYFKLVVVGTSLLALFVVLNHSQVAIGCYWLSWLLMLGVAYSSDLYYLTYALMQGMSNTIYGTRHIRQIFRQTPKQNIETGEQIAPTTGLRPSLFVVPILILFVFLTMYMIGNLDFANAMGDFFVTFFHNLNWIWDLFSFSWLLFITLACFVTGGLIWKNSYSSWSEKQQKHVMGITANEPIPSMAQVNDHFWTAFLTLVLLNILIFVVNAQDFFNLLKPQLLDAYHLRYSVHVGTFALVFSIVIAMSLLFYYFKGDLNFVEKSENLRLLAYVWIGQNALMVLAVAARNYLYISHYGLAYKRVGVIFFLLLVLFGLYTMLLKIKNKTTFTYLFHLNTWAVYGIFILIAAFNWDAIITNYNLKYTDKDKLDASFLLNDISDKNLKTLYENKALLPETSVSRSYSWFDSSNYETNSQTLLEQKKATFLDKIQQEGLPFLSWNYPDAANKWYFGK
jgi:hypothetical protein